MSSQRLRNRFALVAIAALFLVPLLLAVLMRSSGWAPRSTVNAGRLVEPAVRVDLDGARVPQPNSGNPRVLTGRWTMLYVAPGPCEDPCRRDIAALRQVHRASGRDRERVALAVLVQEAPDSRQLRALLDIHPSLVVLFDPSGALSASLKAASDGSTTTAWAFVIDPPGNIILAYPRGFAPADVKQDLQRLLKWSTQDGLP